MKSIKLIAAAAVFVVGLTLASVGWTNPVSDVCTAFGDASTALKLMVIAKDRSAQEALDAKVQAASNKLDSALGQMSGAQAKMAADFKAVWDQFKATREEKIIPAIRNGDIEEAKRIANGIQYVRLSKMWSIMSCK